MDKPYRIGMLGKQGAGKGTQCIRLSEVLGIPHISTGDMLRAALREGTDFGKAAGEFMERGELVPDSIIVGVVAERLAQSDALNDGFVLDGFPRTLAQAQMLEETLAPVGLKVVINLDVSTEVVLDRLSSRRVCVGCGRTYSIHSRPNRNWSCDSCGEEVIQRSDDTKEAIARRLALYDELTAPLIDWYGQLGKLISVFGDGDFDLIHKEIRSAIDSVIG
ncbi:adenylate kinase [Acidithrix ferrooxidans]|uniref:Adenylate kinase n=1 Tax=Acidithrix ferrooxidans TaxID=1280514 RepID=A0A0D8HN75_9ACTN|nr:adenylate kinase [Acidithrix ferrooxidans]KJF18566.1 adenylate kinase [Acidithrix ferrooxidans]